MLFDKFSARSLQLANHMVMAPMTRSRATPEHTPDVLMATYYGQRATAGLIITEGTSPSSNGLGYPRIPGLYDAAQVNAWKATTAAVHARGGKIFVQFMHCGRVAHVANLPTGAEVLGPGTAVCPGEMNTDTVGMQPHSPPRAMTEADIAHAVKEHVTAAKLALDAGFDGVELHGANGYLNEGCWCSSRTLPCRMRTCPEALGGNERRLGENSSARFRKRVSDISSSRPMAQARPFRRDRRVVPSTCNWARVAL